MSHSNEKVITAWTGFIRNAIQVGQPPIADDVPPAVLRVYHAYILIRDLNGEYITVENLMPLYKRLAPSDMASFHTIRMCWGWLIKVFPGEIEASQRTGTGYRYKKGKIQPQITSKKMLPSKAKPMVGGKRVSIKDRINEKMRKLTA